MKHYVRELVVSGVILHMYEDYASASLRRLNQVCVSVTMRCKRLCSKTPRGALKQLLRFESLPL